MKYLFLIIGLVLTSCTDKRDETVTLPKEKKILTLNSHSMIECDDYEISSGKILGKNCFRIVNINEFGSCEVTSKAIIELIVIEPKDVHPIVVKGNSCSNVQ